MCLSFATPQLHNVTRTTLTRNRPSACKLAQNVLLLRTQSGHPSVGKGVVPCSVQPADQRQADAVLCVIGMPPCHAPMRCGVSGLLASGIHRQLAGSREYTACWTIRQVFIEAD